MKNSKSVRLAVAGLVICAALSVSSLTPTAFGCGDMGGGNNCVEQAPPRPSLLDEIVTFLSALI